MPVHPKITKDDVFVSRDYGGHENYFLNCFPNMPDPKQITLPWNYDLMALMSDVGFIYYLPFFLQYLIDHPDAEKYLNVEFLWSRLDKISQENQNLYIESISKAKSYLNATE